MLLRRALPTDAMAIARVHVRSWQVGYRGLLADGFLDGLDVTERAARYTFDAPSPTTTIALDGEAVLGFVVTGPARDTGTGAEIRALYVDPDAWRRGIGRVLIAHARDELAALGNTAATLYVLVGNTRAERFYASDGWRPDGDRRFAAIWGTVVDEVRYRRALP